MSENLDGLFTGGGEFIPSFSFANIGDTVTGKILSVSAQDQRGDDGQPVPDGKGGVKKQVKIVLQTALRGWQGVSRVPMDRETNQPRPASEDDGQRAVYVKSWMFGAVADAVRAATGQPGAPKVGGDLAVRFTETAPSKKPQPIKKYQAQYRPPSGAEAMFEQAAAPQSGSPQIDGHGGRIPQQGGWQQPPAPQAPPAQQGWQQPAPQQAPQQGGWEAPPAPAAGDDPWATSGQFSGQPPF